MPGPELSEVNGLIWHECEHCFCSRNVTSSLRFLPLRLLYSCNLQLRAKISPALLLSGYFTIVTVNKTKTRPNLVEPRALILTSPPSDTGGCQLQVLTYRQQVYTQSPPKTWSHKNHVDIFQVSGPHIMGCHWPGTQILVL